jgi:purine-nucleoside phosphorylase
MFKRTGIIGIEMEAAAMYALAIDLGVKSLTVLTATDELT